MAGSDGFIGVFDSGVGGISVLQSLVRELPHERFCYFGDSAHAPYGDRSPQEVLELSRSIVERMLSDGAKAIVIACNTATSAAAPTLREAYPEVPIVGVEPALKPATLAYPQGRVLVMATAVTLALDKFQKLSEQWGHEAEVIPVACVGLADRVEQGNLEAPDVIGLIDTLVGSYRGQVDAVVLGCTHYSFVREQIRAVLGDLPFFDGRLGTARRLRDVLACRDLLASDGAEGSVTFASSKPGELELYEWFFSQPL